MSSSFSSCIESNQFCNDQLMIRQPIQQIDLKLELCWSGRYLQRFLGRSSMSVYLKASVRLQNINDIYNKIATTGKNGCRNPNFWPVFFKKVKEFCYMAQSYIQFNVMINNSNYLITESEVVTGKSQTEALPYWPSDSEVNTVGRGLRFSRNDLTLGY